MASVISLSMSLPRIFTLVISISIFSFVGHAQGIKDDSTSFSIGGKFQVGSILNLSPELEATSTSSPKLMQLDFGWTNSAKKAWDKCNCYSNNGISLMYSDFGNKEQLGQALSVVLFAEPYITFKRRTNLSFRAGAGPSYMNKVYDKDTNPNNKFFSMPLSFVLMVGFNVSHSFTPHLKVNLGAQLNHISNGGTRVPNHGINYPTIGVGIQYNFTAQELVAKPHTSTPKNVKLYVHLFSGPRVTNPAEPLPEEKALVTGINVGVVKRLAKIIELGIGGEFYVDPISKVYTDRTGEAYQTKIASVSIQNYLLFGKVYFGQQIAYYLTDHNPNIDTNWYQRYLLGYTISKTWTAGVSLKVHVDEADFIAITAGFIL